MINVQKAVSYQTCKHLAKMLDGIVVAFGKLNAAIIHIKIYIKYTVHDE